MTQNTGVRFLHLIIDDKFIDAAIAQFNALTPHNRYILYTPKACYTLKQVRSRDQVELYSCAYRELKRRLADENAYDVLVLHSLSLVNIDLLPSIPDRIKIWWISCGYDIYNKDLIDIERFHERTRALRRELAGNAFFKKDDLRDIFTLLFFQPRSIPFLFDKLRERIARRRESPEKTEARTRTAIQTAIRRVTYCSTVIPDEFDVLIRKEFFTAQNLFFNYRFNRDLCSADTIAADPLYHGNNVLIGNSASFENNHADLFELLRGIPLPGRDIVVPLNYGDTAYARKIVHLGNEYFGTNFKPILDFIPFPQYTEFLRSCCAAIFYHERQQAFGTIVLTLWNGSKVFMSKSSILYNYLKRIGITVFTIQDDLTGEALAAPLSRDTVIAQRTILSKEHSFAAIHAKVQASIEEISRQQPMRN